MFQGRLPPRALRTLMLAALAAMLLLSLGTGCQTPLEHVTLPASIEGGWERGEESSFESAGIHESLTRLSVVKATTATYRNDGVSVRADVYHMPSGTAAFEALQTYPRGADQYYYHVGASFVVLHLGNLPPDARRPFLLAFQAATQPAEPASSE